MPLKHARKLVARRPNEGTTLLFVGVSFERGPVKKKMKSMESHFVSLFGSAEDDEDDTDSSSNDDEELSDSEVDIRSLTEKALKKVKIDRKGWFTFLNE